MLPRWLLTPVDATASPGLLKLFWWVLPFLCKLGLADSVHPACRESILTWVLHPQVSHGSALSPVKITCDFTLLDLSYHPSPFSPGCFPGMPMPSARSHRSSFLLSSLQQTALRSRHHSCLAPLWPLLSEISPCHFVATELPDCILY